MAAITVLHLIDSAGLYGAERVILALLEELRGSHYPGILGCIREKKSGVPAVAEEAQRLGIPVVYFTMRRGYNLFGIRSVLRYLAENNIKIVHSHGYKPNIFLGLPFKKKFKTISTVHGWSKESAGVKGKTYEFLDSLCLNGFDSVIAVSRAVAEDVKRRGVKEKKIDIIHNGLKTNKNYPSYDVSRIRQQYGLDDKAFVIGAVGRLVPVKGHSYLIEAMSLIAKELKDCHLLIAGEGPLRDVLIGLIHKNKIADRARLVGYVAKIEQFLTMIDLFLLPSLSEGLPISLLEAMTAGKPVLASAVGGIPEVIEDNSTGILVRPGDPFLLAESIKALYQDKKMMLEMAMRGREIVENKFSMKMMVQNYLSKYENLFS